MPTVLDSPPIRILPDDVANKIAAGEVVERPASVVKELVENALDAGARRITVRIVAAGRRLIEVQDDGCGMSEQNALLAIERHATSKIRTAQDLEAVSTMGFRGEALASIASVSRFVLVTRRGKDEAGVRIRIDGGVLRDVEAVGAPVGTRITVNRLYFNTPVRAKFLKGITTELSHCIDVVQRHALAQQGVGFQFFHNDKLLLDIPPQADLRERVALIWGLNFARDMLEVRADSGPYRVHGIIGRPGLTRAQRSHQFFYVNHRPVVNNSLQFGFEEGYRGLITIGRRPIGIVLLEMHPRFVDVNIHPSKREVRFREERAMRDLLRGVVRQHLAQIVETAPPPPPPHPPQALRHPEPAPLPPERSAHGAPPAPAPEEASPAPPQEPRQVPPPAPEQPSEPGPPISGGFLPGLGVAVQAELQGMEGDEQASAAPEAVYRRVDSLPDAPLQIFDTYLLVPHEDRLLIIDQHALHERLNYDSLLGELEASEYASQQLAVPIVLEVAPAQVRIVETNLPIFRRVGIELEPFGGNTFQITSLCHLYDEALVRDLFHHILDELAQGDLFDRDRLMADVLRLASRACKASVRAGDRLTPQERRALLDGFQRLRPPYTCPHGRPIITELTQQQMEKSFRRIP